MLGALPRLRRASASGVDLALAHQAAVDEVTCRQYETVWQRARGQDPEAAVASYLDYMTGRPKDVLNAASRVEARRLVQLDVDQKRLTASFCRDLDRLEDHYVVTFVYGAVIGTPLLASCGRALLEARHWAAARLVLTRLQAKMPETTEARATFGDPGRASTKAADRFARPSATPS